MKDKQNDNYVTIPKEFKRNIISSILIVEIKMQNNS